MSAYASEWPPPSPAALLPPQQQQQQQQQQSPVTDDRLRNTSGSSSGGEEKKQSEGDIHMATTPPRRQRKMPPKDEAMGGASNGTAAHIDGTSIGAVASTFASGPSGAAISGSTVESKPEAAIAMTGAGIGGRIHEEEEEEEANNAYSGNGSIPSVQASMSSDSLVRVSAALLSAHADTPPPPPGDEHKLAQLSPRERLVERLPHRPAPAGVVLPEGAVEAINLLPRDQPTPQRRQVPDGAAASLNGLSVPSPPTGGGPFATPSRQQGVMVPSASGVGFAPQQQQLQQQGVISGSGLVGWSQPPPPGRRCIRLRLVEEAHVANTSSSSSSSASAGGESTLRGGLRSSILNSFRKKPKHRGRTMSDAGPDRVGLAPSPLGIPEKQESSGTIDSAAVLARQIDRGVITVSWYDGTGSAELNEHVLRSVRRKLGLAEGITLRDVRIIDESVEPSEEIVLCPYIPDGSMFLLKFSLRDDKAAQEKEQEEERRRRAYQTIDSYISEAPESPSAAPSPHPSTLDLVKLQHILTTSGLVAPAASPARDKVLVAAKGNKGPAIPPLGGTPQKDQAPAILNDGDLEKTVTFKSPVKSPEERKAAEGEGEGKVSGDSTKGEGDKVQDVLRQLTELLGVDGGESDGHHRRRRHRDGSEERKQVVFVLANYFVLFLSLIVISAEIHERAPRWMDWVTTHVDSVQSCSKDSDALYKCVSEGNLAGLVASIIFWVTRSAATKNILLFGFDSPQKLWTVVYEALVSALCWGTSYMFIRRGLNPDTRRNFMHKYWKDAIYGSLAGFNAAFLKAVLKNLIPQDQVLDAVQTRHSVVVGWLSHIFHSGANVEDF